MILDTFSGSVAFSLDALFFHTIAGTNGELPFHFRGALQFECFINNLLLPCRSKNMQCPERFLGTIG
jgi:hypothetical protein